MANGMIATSRVYAWYLSNNYGSLKLHNYYLLRRIAIYVTGFRKTVLNGTFGNSRNTYQFAVLNPLLLSSARVQPCQIYNITRALSYLANVL